MDDAEEYWITVRGVTRLDGARGNGNGNGLFFHMTQPISRVWRPHVRTWGLSEANVLHWSTCDIVGTFRCPHSDSAPGELCSLPPVVTPLSILSSNQRHTESWTLGGGEFSIRPNFAPLWGIRVGEFCRAMVLLKKLAQKYREVFPEILKFCPNLLPPFRAPIAPTQELCQNTSYLQVSGLNNWF